MVERYNPNAIEKKWQKIWDEEKTFKTEIDKSKDKFYALVEFPYPSGAGLHVGHPRSYTALDVVSRKRRMQDQVVLYPMGFDAFGLPTENFAIKNRIHPRVVTEQNIANFTKQLKSIGFSFDWDRVIDTTEPDYYKWTQWIFIQMFKKGLAYKKEFPINWCPSCKVGLANEEVIQGRCERCGTEVEHKIRNQWMLKITEYADRLIDDLDDVDYLPHIKQQQINWIGRSEGAEIDFSIIDSDEKLRVFTTRPDTIYGATYMVIAPEHPVIEKLKNKIKNYDEIIAYKNEANKKSDFERSEMNKDKTGVEIKGLKAFNPISKEEIPVWVSDYVMITYGTGAIMAVPAHDSRDYEFAKKFNLEIRQVVDGGNIDDGALTDTENGKIINSELINGLSVEDAKKKIIKYVEENKLGNAKKNFKLRDWVFSRQRYWGEPIPMVYCEKCGWQPVDEKDLPVKLPDVENYEPSDDGSSPLSKIEDFVNTTCPKCGGHAQRETDTMPQWAGSSWYYLRYMDPNNSEELVGKDAVEYFSPVDWYNGGNEHTTLHLLYSRFWHKFLYDIGVVSTKEPYRKRTSHGMILGENNEKMSKSRGNVVNPDDIIENYGADTLRTYEMFISEFDKSVPWSDEAVNGVRKYLDRVWRLQDILVEGNQYSEDMEVLINQTIKKVTEDYEALKFNTAISQLMILLNSFVKKGSINKKELETYLILLNPSAPHITEEMWQILGHNVQMANQNIWPVYDESKLVNDTIEIPVQINGKVRGKITVPIETSKEEIIAKSQEEENIKASLEGKTVRKVIYVPGKILNIVAN
ncbi:leucine--tRNA ligase [Helcococcus kunzii]|uniref:leucine--tRNA ligase n=1 Tax=Helcococcus kunzii TaxID=40091 RepID=UPI0021A3861C|nr:leucine--tRNA ligase [Helcococcus kunzii]MCT1795584.1 leucine--tRNA ligase [Helcococcus kunzii]MCT1989308.1 leucine--tRNA ligase [Helcococcus kunzii]